MAEEELIKFGNFESWITRSIKESALVGGKTQTLYEVGPRGTFDGPQAYTNQGGSPWANSNVYAKVYGIVKTNVTVYPDKHGNGQCAKLSTQIVNCKAIGVVNISVLASGCIFLGSILEPITSSNDPMSKMNAGVPFKRRPKAVKFDYKYYNPGGERIRETGFSRRQKVGGRDKLAEPDWKEGQTFTIHYGDISRESFYQDGMGLMSGDDAYHAFNSKGKNVPIQEDGWAKPDETPTHIILQFDSSSGGAYVGTIGSTLWIDNVKLVY